MDRRTALAGLGAALAMPQVTRAQGKPAYRLDEVAGPLQNPWGLAFLPDGDMLVTERPGRLRRVTPAGVIGAPVRGVPAVYGVGQGGLLDVCLAPDFRASRRLFLSFSEPRPEGGATAVFAARLSPDATALEDGAVIFRQMPAVSGPVHFGSRIVPRADGTIFVTTGDRGRGMPAQDLGSHIGKVIRIRADGSVPPDNPFVNRAGARPEIWSYGHRNIQGAALHPVTGQLWTVEHGAMGGDEINTPRPGRNYGWPVITYGRDYSGAKIGEGTRKDGMEQPIHFWDPSIAPSGMLFYTGDAFPAWKGSLFVGALAGSHVARLEIDGERIIRQERLLTGLGHRFRDIRQGPDGLIYCLTDAPNGQILRIRPG